MATSDIKKDKYLEAAREIIAGGAKANLDEIYRRHGIGNQGERWAVITRLPEAAMLSVRQNPVER